jgi:glyoxylate/hydroxypyruvate reductase
LLTLKSIWSQAVKIFTNVELGDEARQRLEAGAGPHELYRAGEVLSVADQAALGNCEVAFGQCPPELLLGATELRWLQLDSVGCDPYLDLDWETLSRRVTVTNLRGFFSVPVAESAIGAALGVLRGLQRLQTLQAERKWASTTVRAEVVTLAAAHVMLVGFGDIGRALYGRLSAFGCNIKTFGTERSGADMSSLTDLDRSLAQVDLLFVALPLTPDTKLIIDADRLERMKPGVVLVNVGRGGLIDEDALLHAVRSGRVAGAVLDVTEREPLPATSPLWSSPRILLTQHTAGGTADEDDRKVKFFLENLGRYERGSALANIVNWSRGY